MARDGGHRETSWHASASQMNDRRSPRSPRLSGSQVAGFACVGLLLVLWVGMGAALVYEAALVSTGRATSGVWIARTYDCSDGTCTWHGDFVPDDGGPTLYGTTLESGSPAGVGAQLRAVEVQSLNNTDVVPVGYSVDWMFWVGVPILASGIAVTYMLIARWIRLRGRLHRSELVLARLPSPAQAVAGKPTAVMIPPEREQLIQVYPLSSSGYGRLVSADRGSETWSPDLLVLLWPELFPASVERPEHAVDSVTVFALADADLIDE